MKKLVTIVFTVLISASVYSQSTRNISQGWTSFVQTIEIQSDSDKKFKVVASVKMESADKKASAALWARIDNKTGQGMGFFDNMDNRPIKSNEWKSYVVTGKINSKSKSLSFGGICYNNGKFYFDKFELYIEDENGEYQQVKIKNPGFETEISDNQVQGWDWGIIENYTVLVKEYNASSTKDSADGNLSISIEGSGIKEAGSLGIGYPNIGTLVFITYLLILVFSFMTVVSSPDIDKWSGASKIGFRFSFIYFLLFITFKNNGAYPFISYVIQKPYDWMQKFVFWVAENIYGIPFRINAESNGSGDTTYGYLVVFTIFLLAIIGCTVWSLIDRKRQNYKKLYYWLTTGMRYYVGLMLINYGLAKVIQLQFPEASFYRLMLPYGDSSPMGLAWTFLGFSEGYNLFMGIAEVLAGLLLFRRTLTAGAIITVMTAINVMAVNYFFDVPVKIVSTHLVLITLFLLSRDIRKIVQFLFTNKPVENITKIARPKLNKVINIGLIVLKSVIIAYAFGYGIYNTLNLKSTYGSGKPKPELYGVYKVTNLMINGDTITNYKNEKLWKNFVLEREGSVRVRNMNEKNSYFRIEVDKPNQKIKFLPSTKMSGFDLFYTETDSTLDFRYIHQTDTVSGETVKLGKDDFLLTNRGFNWINERPNNR